MARKSRAVAVMPIDPYSAREAASTIARAHEHLNNPRMMKAVKAHVDGMNAAITGGLKPKKPSMSKKR